MFNVDRLEEIQKLLAEKKSASVRDLAQRLYVSDATVRRDLNALERQGLVRRIFGGVVLVEHDQRSVPFFARTMASDVVNDGIALKALGHIHNGQTLMLDASTTVSALIPHLKRFKDLTIITNASAPMTGLQELDAKVYVIGGLMPRHSLGYVGYLAEDMVRNFNADILFFTCGGIALDGRISSPFEEEAGVQRAMLRHARKKILLCDREKFGRECLYNLTTLEEIDTLISDVPFYREQQGDWTPGEARSTGV